MPGWYLSLNAPVGSGVNSYRFTRSLCGVKTSSSRFIVTQITRYFARARRRRRSKLELESLGREHANLANFDAYVQLLFAAALPAIAALGSLVVAIVQNSVMSARLSDVNSNFNQFRTEMNAFRNECPF
jgi:hypothetical protein